MLENDAKYLENMTKITIAGQLIELKELSIHDQRGLWLELIANFKMMQFCQLPVFQTENKRTKSLLKNVVIF